MDDDWSMTANCDLCQRWADVGKLGELWLCQRCLNDAVSRRQAICPNQHFELCAECNEIIHKYAGVLVLGRWWHLSHFTEQSHITPVV